jgi:hypothetical protein
MDPKESVEMPGKGDMTIMDLLENAFLSKRLERTFLPRFHCGHVVSQGTQVAHKS